jgi:ATP-dependent Lon protease
MSLGGVRDEAEIRGHRRTYIGSMPGKIVQSMKQGEDQQPALPARRDRQDGQDFRGDPSSALLEVLDPEQNATFNDHYLEVDYDLSNVMFVTTANTLQHPAAACWTAWRSSASPATPRMRRSRSPSATSSPSR